MSTVHRVVALGTAVTLTAGISMMGASAAHAEGFLSSGVELPVPATDITETDSNLGSVAREVVVVSDGPDGKPEVRKFKARTQAEAEQLASGLNAKPGVVAEVNQARKIDATVSVGTPTKDSMASAVDGSGSRRQSVPALAGEVYGSYQWGLPAVGAESAWGRLGVD